MMSVQEGRNRFHTIGGHIVGSLEELLTVEAMNCFMEARKTNSLTIQLSGILDKAMRGDKVTLVFGSLADVEHGVLNSSKSP